jgi:hypothetical protein
LWDGEVGDGRLIRGGCGGGEIAVGGGVGCRAETGRGRLSGEVAVGGEGRSRNWQKDRCTYPTSPFWKVTVWREGFARRMEPCLPRCTPRRTRTWAPGWWWLVGGGMLVVEEAGRKVMVAVLGCEENVAARPCWRW